MRSNPADFPLTAPPTLSDLLRTLHTHPNTYTLLAGGTELMVALNTGRLPPKPLLSIAHLADLRFIRHDADTITLGAATTFTDIRRSEIIAQHLPLLAQAASWTGSVANQNRGTLGGNLANASPAADTPPVLLVYDAQVHVLSSAGPRTIPYTDFHLSYKRTALRPDEILHSISIPCNWHSHKLYLRKVGTRNAQAISKVVLAATARTEATYVNDKDQAQSSVPNTVTDIRLAAASVADRPLRLYATEATLLHQPLTPATLAQARATLLAEVAPIDDIRSTAAYRSTVAANLLEDFLTSLREPPPNPR